MVLFAAAVAGAVAVVVVVAVAVVVRNLAVALRRDGDGDGVGSGHDGVVDVLILARADHRRRALFAVQPASLITGSRPEEGE